MPRARKLPELEVVIQEITPELAEEWLKKNIFNRKMSDRLVLTYVEAMKAGEWRLNGETIIFDWDDRLQQGQHRLQAVVDSGTTIWSVVVFGAEPEAIFTLDGGRKRTTGDALRLIGEHDVANLGTALSWTWRYQSGLMTTGGVGVTTPHLLKLLEKTPCLREDLSWGRQIKTSLGWSAGLFAMVYHVLHGIDEDDAHAFWEQICFGEDLSSDMPAFVLRRTMLRMNQETRRPSSTHLAALTFKAWNAYRRHDYVKVLTFKGSEQFPVPE